jgi:sugar phosphate isomerase/epimerase
MPKPLGIELWTVRTDLKADYLGTLTRVAGLGYSSVEIFSTYLDWTLDYARKVRAHLESVGLTCSSTHNGMRAFTPEAIDKTVELNNLLGSRMAIVASVPKIETLDGWRQATASFADVAERLRPHGIAAGFHNHQHEWTPLEGELPIEIVAGGTPKDFVMQLDIGPAVQHGIDVPAWIRAHAGRVRSLHMRDWSATKGYDNIGFGEGDCPWPAIIEAADAVGVCETYQVENGHSTPEQEWGIAERSIANWNRMRA